jgi:hypothetical protein
MPGKWTRTEILPSKSTRTEYEWLEEGQVRKGPGGLFYAMQRGRRWLLFGAKWPRSDVYLVKPDGSLWFDIDFKRRFPWRLNGYLPVEGTETQCDDCFLLQPFG